ncbi:MAG: hypothetical protein A3G80_01650 [Betaproteobacteria bacterium RIFCSPLOWO2_12_FULL_62_13b]|nr:MAG: hypothetical protein A3G80_01650 [Betaproteobacteria bacterium RIFCSPLOWO2_12_FULL_62_13b]
MALRHIGFDQIDEACLQRLIATGAAEARDIEYKSATYGGNDDARAEFLADVSSLANTVGGDLIIGMAANNGIPTALAPLMTDIEKECLRLDSMARDGLEPRIPNLQIKAVPLLECGAAIVIRIPRSYNPPHRVVFKGKNRFWARSSAGKYEPDVDELRTLFTLAPQLADRIRGFRADRIAKIAAGEAPAVLTGSFCIVMHLVPFSAFDIGSDPAVSLAYVNQHPDYFPTLFAGHPPHWRVNFDGFLALSNSDANATQQRAYVQLFRSGIVEAVAAIGGGYGAIERLKLEAGIVRYSWEYADSLHACGVEPPLALLVSLLGTRGQKVMQSRGLFPEEPAILDRDQFHFSEVILEEVPKNDQACGPMVRSILDQLANAAGHPVTPTFDANGKYLLKF